MTRALALTDAHDWIDSFCASVEPQLADIHPSARSICREYIRDMHRAATAGDMQELARLLALTQDKIAEELIWAEHVLRSAADRHYVPRCMR